MIFWPTAPPAAIPGSYAKPSPRRKQADLLEALGERGDAVARPKVLELVDGKEEVVRVASLRALGGLGSAADVPILAKWAATGSDNEKSAALQSLVRLRGDDVNEAINEALWEFFGLAAALVALRDEAPEELQDAIVVAAPCGARRYRLIGDIARKH